MSITGPRIPAHTFLTDRKVHLVHGWKLALYILSNKNLVSVSTNIQIGEKSWNSCHLLRQTLSPLMC